MSYLGRFSIYFIILLFFILTYPLPVKSSIVLNEVAIQPNQVVELYNTASTSADISSWYIDDAGGTTYYTISSQTIIPPQSCLLFSSDFNFNKSSADVVRLFDNSYPPTSSSAKLIEQYSYTKAPDSNYSFSKKKDGGTEWQTTISSLGLFNETLTNCIPTTTPTPLPTETPAPNPTATLIPSSEPTQTPTPTPLIDYQNIYISEIYPYPLTGENEWIEIYNGNNIQVNLDHWYIDDIENGGSTPKSFTLVLEPFTYGVIDMSSSLFNNGGDNVRLLNHDKIEKDSMEYGKITQGKSMGRISFLEESYCEQDASKNTANSSCILEPTQIVSLQTTNNKTMLSTQKIVSPAKKSTNLSTQQTTTSEMNPNSKTASSKQVGEVLGMQTKETNNASLTPYLSGVSFSYSLLTIVSVFIKMKNA
ncbi:MAG: lamin tail domain-containing protein [Candidatus Roizmanbacteria bacterium]|nr:lamin tail domain-containing protein [Candidatus Roizmanbacteria bacterium]